MTKGAARLAALPTLLTLALGLGLPGCATRPPLPGSDYDVQVEARAPDGDPGLRRLILMPPGADPAAADATFAHYALYAAAILGARGYVITDDLAATELVVVLDYAISAPQVLVWPGQGGQPAKHYTLYAREMRLTAYDWVQLHDAGERREVFRISASSTGLGGDLAQVMPYLAVAMQPYIGKERSTEIRLRADDERVVWLRNLVERLRHPAAFAGLATPGRHTRPGIR